MAVDKPLTDFFGGSAAQTETTVTFTKSELTSNKTPAAWTPLVPKVDNTAESIFTAAFLRVYERQDQSPDAQVAIFPGEASYVEIVSDGVTKIAAQATFTVRFLEIKDSAMPNPNAL